MFKPLRIARAREQKPVDLIANIYDRIAREGERPVWISLTPREEALQRAESVGGSDMPFAGTPFAVKDNIDVAGMPTTAACPSFAHVPTRSAAVVDRLLAAGAILIGKTNLDQFATGLVGTRSPYGACSSVFDSRYISGGSSSGSAVAVASGLVSFALGTDTAGSGRVPAAFNHITGLKPTRGLLSTRGVTPACRSLDCVSIFAADADDAALAFEAARGFDPEDPFSRESVDERLFPSSIRLGVPWQGQLNFAGDADAERLFWASVDLFRAIGGTVVEVDISPFLEAARLLYQGAWVAERYAAVGEFLEREVDGIDPIVREIILKAKTLSAVDSFRASYKLAELRRTAEATWESINALALPTTPTIYTHAEIAERPIERNSILGTYTNFVNVMDLAAIAVPAGFRTNGLPFGLSLIGPAFSDRALLQAASRYERELQKRQRRMIRIAVVGAHLTGQPLNWQLTERRANLVRVAKTAPQYRFYALTGTKPEKPGLILDPGFEGPGIELEIWEMPEEHAGSFLKLVTPPLAIGTVHLADGDTVQGFVCEGHGVSGAREITHFGGWRAYRASQG